MKPVYFPLTNISLKLASAIAEVLGPIIVYQAVPDCLPDDIQQASQQGLIEVLCPKPTSNLQLKPLIQEYLKWAQIHAGGSLDFFKSHKDWMPFDDHEMAHKLRSVISGKKPASKPESTDLLTNARIFLGIAQEFDIQRHEIVNGIKLVTQMEQELFENLKGEDSPLPAVSPAPVQGDPGDYMPEQRLAAWGHLFLSDPFECCILITDSHAIEQHIKKKFELKTVLRLQWSLKSSNNFLLEEREKLMSVLKQLQEDGDAALVPPPFTAREPEPNVSMITIEICSIPSIHPQTWVERLTGKETESAGIDHSQSEKKYNTLLGFMYLSEF